MGIAVIVVLFVAAILTNDHFNCKRRRRHALKWQLKAARPLTAEEISSWEPIWTIFVPRRWYKDKV